MDSNQVVNLNKNKGVATITINNPPVNVLSATVVNQLTKVVEKIEVDREIIAVIITGGGEKSFVAGGNIKEFPGWMEKGSHYAEMKSRWLQHPLNKIDRLSKPTIAAMNGLALGGGCELALSCDIRIAEEQILIGLPEITLGLFPGAGGTQRLPRLVGEGKAMELMFTGEAITAREAKSIGLVNMVVSEGQALEKAQDIAQRISQFSLPALAFLKKAIVDGRGKSLEEGLQIEAQYFGEVFQTNDIKEGVSAFLEKRKPKFIHT